MPQLYLFTDEIGQVWTNLIQNAIQAMQGQGELWIQAQRVGDELQVAFIDTGPGIPPEILPRIFEPFFTTKAKGEGTGLGLDICRRIVEKHQGRITVESRPGRTQFVVHLPLLLSQPDWYVPESHSERI
ncbi:MAG: ATP-binding protein [Bacteroidia bacterium]|nr:ATP-binding protein [Bacteroidia bacterium]